MTTSHKTPRPEQPQSAVEKTPSASHHPYQNLAPSHFWNRSVSRLERDAVTPCTPTSFKISRQDKVMTAGSCFAQHISRALQALGFNFLQTELPPFFVSPTVARRFGYGLYSARYGNQYTPRQMLQLLQRSYAEFEPAENIWLNDDGSVIDPFRPQIEPGGYPSPAALSADRRYHFQCVRNALERADVLVFTLGLTECWHAPADGAVFPLCPGVAGGYFDPERHAFLNLGVAEINQDLLALIDYARRKNGRLKIILTVSPVPLAASFSNQHVLVANSYSKSVLRVCCDAAVSAREAVVYFPAYEIITGPQAPDDYFEADRRHVSRCGVARVMQVFSQTLLDDSEETTAPTVAQRIPNEAEQRLNAMQQAIEILCDEEALDDEG